VTSHPILTAEEMVAAEDAAMKGGVSVGELMDRAGKAVADIAWRMTGKSETLILCGPGNNGGDGYVVARLLAERGCDVRVAALADPGTEVAKAARERWKGPVEPIAGAKSAPLVVDALFGTGLVRPLSQPLSKALADHVGRARYSIAVDLPSGIATDSGALLSPVPAFDVTVALGALKPAHLLQPAARFMGRIMPGDIGIAVTSSLHALGRPTLATPTPDDYKYSRGYVLVAAGEMAGAAALTAMAAMRAGAGYVALAGEAVTVPHALVHKPTEDAGALAHHLDDPRISVVVIGPGLGVQEEGRRRFERALMAGHRLVIDADALNLLADSGLGAVRDQEASPILTPHAGEFVRLFGEGEGSKVDRTRDAAVRSDSVVIYKGGDTVIAAPDGRAAIAQPAPSWLASAGTGDVLTGIVAARYAATGDAFTAACEAVWLHGEAARRAGPFLIADDLVDAMPGALAACL
jgi:ADP-dependent NAD(P)H-hydrate dehydratase / NAD(P)H-hydrate epimerase